MGLLTGYPKIGNNKFNSYEKYSTLFIITPAHIKSATTLPKGNDL
jgi:hypothetical protein